MSKVSRVTVVALLMAAMVLVGTVVVKAATINVPGDYATIQGAIDNAVGGDTVLVADGTYVENINFLGKDITVRSQNGAATTIIDGHAADTTVSFISGEGAGSVLDGFSVINGFGRFWSGIDCDASSPTIQNCNISYNSGSGIGCRSSSSPVIFNCNIHNNQGYGIDCVISSSPEISYCTISNNINEDGGGIRCTNFSSPAISYCRIIGNTALYGGGGIYCDLNSSPTITNCTIKDNYSANWGGGIYCRYDTAATIINSVISGNRSYRDGGGIFVRDNDLSIIANSTVAGNTSEIGLGGGIYSQYSSPTVVNSILWGDMASGVPDEIGVSKSSAVDVTYSVIEGSYIGTGNSKANPYFLNTASGNYRLLAGSSAIDSANSDAPAPATDKDGNARYDDPATANTGVGANGDYYDRGAYEFVDASCTDADSDGYYAEVVCGGEETDCDDTDANINPGAAEICDDGIDNNCDGQIDEPQIYYEDSDSDGYGNLAASVLSCSTPAGYVADNTDCNDTDPAVNPGAAEVCGDGIDNNCNNQIDEGCCTDADGDTYAVEGGSCGLVDCDDSDPTVNPGAAEVCGDGIDNNCDSQIDEGCCTDADGDGYYAEAGCGTEVDCDDSNPDINPGACDIKRNGIDEDCDGADRLSGPACSGGGNPEICDDGIDNDGDGKVDCDDRKDCRNFPGC